MIPAARTAVRRPFSVLASARTAARSFEAHPFQRLPISQRAARPDWAREVKRVGSQALVFFPAFAVMLGWPFAAKSLVDGHV
ncbi:hypothetical protein HRG_009447 [Hirsutella rhossiliensis]|uniref:Pantothenate transporter liz1 n=1 Tax=Hirsutella rhossiliensis TaxID=111463 RepID=A0A9P8MQY3_9HYPO|nr:uncharacterized protein HRG_09447 [Hirsutella rhossiliensis]KAH0959665.1 hypothetical protein HRG_09447 [Hirsutella rhossiliensis]